MNTHSITELTQRLITSLNSHYDIIDMDTVLYVIKELERTRITKEQLETTRIARYINQLRKRTKSENLAKRSKELLKKWHDIFIPITTPCSTQQQQPQHQSSSNSTIQQYALIPETSTSRSQTNSRKKHQNGDNNSNTFIQTNNNDQLINNIPHTSNNYLTATNKLPTSFANLLPTSSANVIRNSQNSDMMLNNDSDQNMGYLHYKNNTSKNLLYEYEQNSNQSVIDNNKSNKLYGTSNTMHNLMNSKEYILNQTSKNRYNEQQNNFSAESITIGLSDSNSHKSYHGKDQHIPMTDSLQTGNEFMPAIVNKLNKKHKKEKKQKKDKEKNLIQNKLGNTNNFPRAISKSCKNNDQTNSYISSNSKLNNMIPINEDDVDDIVLKSSYNQLIPNHLQQQQYQHQYQQQQQHQQQQFQQQHQQQFQQQNNRELLSISNSSLSIFSIQNETNDDHDSTSFNQKHMDLTFSGKFNPTTTSSAASRTTELDTVLNISQIVALSSPGSKSCTNKKEYPPIVILDESSRSCSPFTNTYTNQNSCKLPIELVSNVSRSQNLNENSQNSNMGLLPILRNDATIETCENINDKAVENLELTDNLIENSIYLNLNENKTIPEEKIPKKRGRKKGSKGIDSLLAQSIQYTKSSQQQLLDQSTRLLTGVATSMVVGGNSTTNKKVKTTKELLAAIQNRKAYGNLQQNQMIPSNLFSPTLMQYTEQQNQQQDSTPHSISSERSISPNASEVTIINQIDADLPRKRSSVDNSIFVDDSTDSEATTKSNFNMIDKSDHQKYENDGDKEDIKLIESCLKLKNDILILNTEDKILQLFSQLPIMPKNFLNEIDLNYLNSIPCTCKVQEIDVDLDKENLTENGNELIKILSPQIHKSDLTNNLNIPKDNSQKTKQYSVFNLDIDGDKTANSNDDWFITNSSNNNNPCRTSPILENSNSVVSEKTNFKTEKPTQQYPIKRSIFDSDYDEADDPLHKLVEEQKKLKEKTKKDKLLKHKKKSKQKKYTKGIDLSDNDDVVSSENSRDSISQSEDKKNINLNSEQLQNLDDSINYNSNFTSVDSDFMEVEQSSKNNDNQNVNPIFPINQSTVLSPLELLPPQQENLSELQNIKKFEIIEDDNCLALKKYILKPKNISLLYIDLLHNYYVPNANGNWSTLNNILEKKEDINNIKTDNIEIPIKTNDETILKIENSNLKTDSDMLLENIENLPLTSLSLEASQLCDRKSVISPTECIECNKIDKCLDKFCEIHSNFDTITINYEDFFKENKELHERVVPLYSHLVEDKIQKKFDLENIQKYNLKFNNTFQRICLKCNKKRKLQFKLNKIINNQNKSENNQNSHTDNKNSNLNENNIVENGNYNENLNNLTSNSNELDTKCDLLNNFNLLNNNVLKNSCSNAEINSSSDLIETKLITQQDISKNISNLTEIVQNYSNKIHENEFSKITDFVEINSLEQFKKFPNIKNEIEFQNKVLTEIHNNKEESIEQTSMLQNDSDIVYEPEIKKIKLLLLNEKNDSNDLLSPSGFSPVSSDLKLNDSASTNFANTSDSTDTETTPEKHRRSSNCSNTSLKQTQNSINLKLKSRLKEKQLRKEKKEQLDKSDCEGDENSDSSSCSNQISDNCESSTDDETNSSVTDDDNSGYSTSSSTDDNHEDDSERDDSETSSQDYHEVVRHDMKTSSKTGNKHIVLTIKKTPSKLHGKSSPVCSSTSRILSTEKKTGSSKLNVNYDSDCSNDSIDRNRTQNQFEYEHRKRISKVYQNIDDDDDNNSFRNSRKRKLSTENNSNFQLSPKFNSSEEKFQLEPHKIHTENSCQIRKLERLSIELNNSIYNNLNLNSIAKIKDLATHKQNNKINTKKYFRELRRKSRLNYMKQKKLNQNIGNEIDDTEINKNNQSFWTVNQENNNELNKSNCHNEIPNLRREKKLIRNRDILFFPEEIHDQYSTLIFNQDCENISACSCSSCCYSSSYDISSDDETIPKNDSNNLEVETENTENNAPRIYQKNIENDSTDENLNPLINESNRTDFKLCTNNDDEDFCNCPDTDTEEENTLNSNISKLNHSPAENTEFEQMGDNNNNEENLNKLDTTIELNSDNSSLNRIVDMRTDLEINSMILNNNNDMLESFNSINLSEQEELKSNKEFKEWHEVLKLMSHDNQPLTILPYVIID